MTRRAVVSVATGPYVKGLDRIGEAGALVGAFAALVSWRDMLPPGCPSHSGRPYAFKAYALQYAAQESAADTLLWCDASILPIRPLEPLWERIERDGIWFSRNGWTNAQWTADSAYADLFPGVPIDEARAMNAKIPHVVATAFGISLRTEIGRAFLAAYFRLASETTAFCGPWKNSDAWSHDRRTGPCGPPSTLGHRHDQTCASVICARLGVTLTDPPDVFAYRGGETEKTILVADGAY